MAHLVDLEACRARAKAKGHSWNAAARANVWFEWVKSAANPADEPSRDLELAEEVWRLRSWLSSTPVEVVYPRMIDDRDERCWGREAEAARAGVESSSDSGEEGPRSCWL